MIQDFPPKTQCPSCGEWIEDFDGFGVLAHEECGLCYHPDIYDEVCIICGADGDFELHKWGTKLK